MKLYGVQFRQKSPQHNLKLVLEFLEKVEENSLVLLPEMWYSGFDYEKLEEHARKTEEVLEVLKDVSRKKSLTLCGTLPEKTKEGIKNTAFLVEDGKIIGKRGKIKLFKPFGEDKYFIPERENSIFKTKFGKVGILICFELRFTDLILELQREKPDIVLVPAQWGYARREHFRVLSKARAIELQAYLIASDTWGEHLGVRYGGNSGIYSPWGEVLSFSEKGDTLLFAEYDPDYLKEVRESLPIKI
ncbi:carbon-nitrogen hydrolase family protein [Aquifex pyrophilus]